MSRGGPRRWASPLVCPDGGGSCCMRCACLPAAPDPAAHPECRWRTMAEDPLLWQGVAIARRWPAPTLVLSPAYSSWKVPAHACSTHWQTCQPFCAAGCTQALVLDDNSQNCVRALDRPQLCSHSAQPVCLWRDNTPQKWCARLPAVCLPPCPGAHHQVLYPTQVWLPSAERGAARRRPPVPQVIFLL
jgi:hypothetical protein